MLEYSTDIGIRSLCAILILRYLVSTYSQLHQEGEKEISPK